MKPVSAQKRKTETNIGHIPTKCKRREPFYLEMMYLCLPIMPNRLLNQKNMKRAVIIGATSGIGREVARLLLRQGWHIGVAGRREDLLRTLQAEAPDRTKFRQVDVTSKDCPRQILDLIADLGGMDLFLLCAGIGRQNPDLTPDIELRTAETNVTGFIRAVNTAYDWFRSHGGGHLAAISSIAGTKGLGAAPAYSATKRFQNTYLDALAQLARMQHLPIRFTDIRPGFVDTDLLRGDKHYPMLMRPERVARRIVRALEHKERVCVIDWRYKILVFFWRLIPRFVWERLPIRN